MKGMKIALGALFLVSPFVAKAQQDSLVNEGSIKEVMIMVDKKMQINKLKISKIEYPMTINTVDVDMIYKRNITNVEEALKNVTGINAINGWGGFLTFSIRGFQDFALLKDGVRDERFTFDSWAPLSNLSNVERIEVIKGPEGVLFGHSVLGGIVNIVRKKPSDQQKADVKITYGSFNTYEATVGVGGPISKTLRYRVDVGTHHSDGWRNIGFKRNNATLTLDYSPTKNDDFEFIIHANNDNNSTESGLPTKPNVYGIVELEDGVNRKVRYSDPEDKLHNKAWGASLKYTHKFNPNLMLTNNLSYYNDDIIFESVGGNLLVNNTKTSIRRKAYSKNTFTDFWINSLDLTYKVQTGEVKHKIALGYFFSHYQRNIHRISASGPGATTDVDIHNPMINQGYRVFTLDKDQVKKETVNAFFLQDWVNFSDKFKALLGFRYDIFHGKYYEDRYKKSVFTNSIDQGKGTNHALTYRIGLVYIPVKDIWSIYGSYSNYFKPTRVFDADGKIFDPDRGAQFEIGTKIQYGSKFDITLAGFYILKDNILEKLGHETFKRIGKVDSRGFEIDFNVRPMENLNIKAGYSYAFASIRNKEAKESVTGENAYKKRVSYSPEHLFNFWTDYKFTNNFLKGLGLGVGMNYVGDMYTYSNQTFKTPSYFLVDANLYYQLGNAQLGIHINNIFNENYYSSSIGNLEVKPMRILVIPGMERNYTVSLKYSF